MNIGSLLGAAKGFLVNKHVGRATLGGLAGFRQGNNMWKTVPAMFAAEKKAELAFKIKLNDSVVSDSFLNHKNLTDLIQKQYPSDRILLKDFTLRYDPAAKTIEFEPTDKFIEECLKDSKLLDNMKLKLQFILTNTIGLAALGTTVGVVADKGAELFKKYIKKQEPEEQVRLANMLFEELEKRAVSDELDKIATNIDLNCMIANYFRE